MMSQLLVQLLAQLAGRLLLAERLLLAGRLLLAAWLWLAVLVAKSAASAAVQVP